MVASQNTPSTCRRRQPFSFGPQRKQKSVCTLITSLNGIRTALILDSESEGLADSDWDSEGDEEVEKESDGDGDSEGDADRDGDGEGDSEREGDGELELEGDSDVDGDADSEGGAKYLHSMPPCGLWQISFAPVERLRNKANFEKGTPWQIEDVDEG